MTITEEYVQTIQLVTEWLTRKIHSQDTNAIEKHHLSTVRTGLSVIVSLPMKAAS